MTAPKDRDYYMKFVPDVWRADEGLASSSLAARGLWMELMCVAHKSGGLVLINGKSPDILEIAKQARAKPSEVRKLLEELKSNGVCSLREDGTIFSRRMVRDHARRVQNRENGLSGGNPTLVAGLDKQSVNRTVNRKSNYNSNSRSGSGVVEKKDPDADSFAEFWARYPRHVKRSSALSEWRKIPPTAETIHAIHAALDWQINQPGWLEKRGKFVPHASTWIHQRRWEDEPFHAPQDVGSVLGANDDIWASLGIGGGKR